MSEQSQIVLQDLLRFKIAKEIGKAAAQMSDVRLKKTVDKLVAEVRLCVLSERVLDQDLIVEFPFPKNWWEHLKLTVLPKLPNWWRKRVRVKLSKYRHRVHVRQDRAYPRANEVMESRWGKPVDFESWWHAPESPSPLRLETEVLEADEHPAKE